MTLLMVWLALAGCSTTSSMQVDPVERDAVIAVVNATFDAMRDRDSEALRETMTPEIAMIRVDTTSGASVTSITMGSEAVDQFANAIVNAPEQIIERMWDPEVRIDGDLATLWAPYDLHFGETFSHCGIDAFQLVRGDDDRWRIVSVAYTRRKDGCETAPER